MKKVFLEPDARRIELNLRENIATSSTVSLGYYFNVSLFICTIQTTGKTLADGVTEQEAAVCLVANNARSMGVIIPREEVLPHFRH